MLKFAIAGALGGALSFLGTFGFAQEAPPAHRDDWPIHNGHKYQPTSLGSFSALGCPFPRVASEPTRKLRSMRHGSS
jgi:hypothetical protein